MRDGEDRCRITSPAAPLFILSNQRYTFKRYSRLMVNIHTIVLLAASPGNTDRQVPAQFLIMIIIQCNNNFSILYALNLIFRRFLIILIIIT